MPLNCWRGLQHIPHCLILVRAQGTSLEAGTSKGLSRGLPASSLNQLGQMDTHATPPSTYAPSLPCGSAMCPLIEEAERAGAGRCYVSGNNHSQQSAESWHMQINSVPYYLTWLSMTCTVLKCHVSCSRPLPPSGVVLPSPVCSHPAQPACPL